VAPLQGISNVQLKNNSDGSTYLSISFAGPIRSAGGTEAALIMLIADHARKVVGISEYLANSYDDETGRFVEELRTYEREVGNFQFKVLDEDVIKCIKNLPVELDGIDTDQHVIATFRLRTAPDRDLRAAAIQMALVASIGTVKPLPLESTAAREAVGPRILHPTRPAMEREGEVTIAFPVDLFGTKDIITQLMGVTMFGGEYNYVDEVRLESLDIPRPLLENIGGPKFGIGGVRSVLGVVQRPLLAVIVKPRLGVPLDVVAEAVKDALVGGADVVLDDELVVDPDSETNFESRTSALVRAAEIAAKKTSEVKGVFVNVTARPSLARGYAERAVELGADGLIFNAFVCGVPSLQELVEFDRGLPVFATNVGSGLLTRATNPTGVRNSVHSRLSRLAGADGVQTGILAGDAYTTEAWGPSVISLDRPLAHLKPSLPIVAGGLNVANLWGNWNCLGDDVLFAAGSGILGFPQGPLEGARCLRQLLDTLSSDLSNREAAHMIIDLAKKKGSSLADGLKAYRFDLDELERADS
jgi:ribulose 1,5-bisphosphate carboxylase large subunit-like protein